MVTQWFGIQSMFLLVYSSGRSRLRYGKQVEFGRLLLLSDRHNLIPTTLAHHRDQWCDG